MYVCMYISLVVCLSGCWPCGIVGAEPNCALTPHFHHHSIAHNFFFFNTRESLFLTVLYLFSAQWVSRRVYPRKKLFNSCKLEYVKKHKNNNYNCININICIGVDLVSIYDCLSQELRVVKCLILYACPEEGLSV